MGSKPGALIKTFLEIRQFEVFWFSDIFLLCYRKFCAKKCRIAKTVEKRTFPIE